MSLFEKLKSFFSRKDSKVEVVKNLNSIKDKLIDEIGTYALDNINNSHNPVMMETDIDGKFWVYPNPDDYYYDIAYRLYNENYNTNVSNKDKEVIRTYIDELCHCELAYALGVRYQQEYSDWEDEYYKDADDIEEEMWNFEVKGELKYKGFIERAAENAANINTPVDLNITPNLEVKEIELHPYIEHDEDPNEIVSLEDGSIELVETSEVESPDI